MEHFADRLMRAVSAKSSQVVVGLDPRLERMPQEVTQRAFRAHGRTPRGAAAAIVEFNRAVLDAVEPHAVAVKPQIAFYECYGVEGMRAYAETIAAARDRCLIVIGDVKRNDIASTAQAYASAHLGADNQHPMHASDFLADAITINPYLGADGVLPFLEAAGRRGKGVFALVKTSNPSSVEVQDVRCEGRPLYERVAALTARWGGAYRGDCGYSFLGAVVGATFPEQLRRLRALMPHAPLLVPGFGAQGAGAEDVAPAFDSQGLGAVVNSSRGIIFAWQRAPYDEQFGGDHWRRAVGAAAADMREQLWHVTH